MIPSPPPKNRINMRFFYLKHFYELQRYFVRKANLCQLNRIINTTPVTELKSWRCVLVYCIIINRDVKLCFLFYECISFFFCELIRIYIFFFTIFSDSNYINLNIIVCQRPAYCHAHCMQFSLCNLQKSHPTLADGSHHPRHWDLL